MGTPPVRYDGTDCRAGRARLPVVETKLPGPGETAQYRADEGGLAVHLDDKVGRQFGQRGVIGFATGFQCTSVAQIKPSAKLLDKGVADDQRHQLAFEAGTKALDRHEFVRFRDGEVLIVRVEVKMHGVYLREL